MIVLLIPVILVEFLVIRRRVSVRPMRLLGATAAANIVSTLVGIPLTWGALFLGEIAIWSGLNLLPFPWLDTSWFAPSNLGSRWMVALITTVLLVPFYFVSVWIERRVMRRLLPVSNAREPQPHEVGKAVLWVAVRDANLLSYGLLFLLALALLVRMIVRP
jgi:predicted neutral ceramidase superfamily lipid hydrolase